VKDRVKEKRLLRKDARTLTAGEKEGTYTDSAGASTTLKGFEKRLFWRSVTRRAGCLQLSTSDWLRMGLATRQRQVTEKEDQVAPWNRTTAIGYICTEHSKYRGAGDDGLDAGAFKKRRDKLLIQEKLGGGKKRRTGQKS